MRILLLNPPNIEEMALDAQTVPLGLLFIRSYLQQLDHIVDILNLYYEKSWVDVASKLQSKEYDIAGIPCYTQQRFSVFKLADTCKSVHPSIPIVLGGPHATFLDIEILKYIEAIDYIIRGEGELPLAHLLRVLEHDSSQDISTIRGITYRNGRNIIRNSNNPQLQDLSLFPKPTYLASELSNFSDCRSLTFHFHPLQDQGPIAPILASRGCNNACQFCCNGTFWEKQVYYPPTYVLDQILDFYINHNIRIFDFYDDDLPRSKDHIKRLCELIINNKLNIRWWCSSRSQALDRTTLMTMRDAGCFMLSYGIESGSQRILDHINKNICLEECRQVINVTKSLDLKVRLTCSIGNPGETDDSVGDTLKFIFASKPDQLGLFLTKIYPGTPLCMMAEKQGLIDKSYWFNREAPNVPFYTADHSIERLLEYRNTIRRRLKNHIVQGYTSHVHSIELDLKW